MESVRLLVTDEYEGERVDKVIAAEADALSRSFVQKMIKNGEVTVGGKAVKAGYKVSEGDEIAFAIPKSVEPEILPQNIPLDILYEDEELLVVNKPKGMVVHPAAGHYTDTLVNALMYHCEGKLSGINGVLRPGIVHRIDMDTTGALVVCKSDAAHQSLSSQLKEHSITRRYRAIASGSFPETSGTIDAPIGRDPNNRKKMCINERNGKRAVTHFDVIRQLKGYAYIECRLETGRTHQIRVHMSSIGHPLLGDVVYGKQASRFHLKGQTLHAMTLGFVHPKTGEYMEFEAPLPDYFKHLLEILD